VTTGENASVIARLFEAYIEGRKDEALQLLADLHDQGRPRG
jgi:hypothetical protein